VEKAGDLLKSFLNNSQMDTAKRYSSLFRSWGEAAGTDIASHSEVIDIKGDTVLVGVDHPGWMQMIHFKEKNILRYLKKQFPELGICKLHVKLIEKDIYQRNKMSEKKERGTASPGSKKEFEKVLQQLKISIENNDKNFKEGK